MGHSTLFRLAETSLERRAMKPRNGVTLIELLVAMVIAGIISSFVAGWIVHTARQSSAAQRRDDREQEWSLLRNELFQDGTRGHTLELGKTSWKFVRPGSGAEPDTIEWRFGAGTLTRSGAKRLPLDTLLEATITPRFSPMDPNWDAWIQADRNYDGLVDPEILPNLERFELVVVVKRRATPSSPSLLDTLRLMAPLLGPG